MEILVSIGSGNGLLPVSTKPLADPMLIYLGKDTKDHTSVIGTHFPPGTRELSHCSIVMPLVWHQAIIWTNADSVNWALRNKIQWILNETAIYKNFCNQIHLEMSAKWWPFYSGPNVLTHWGRDKMAAISQTTHSNPFSWMKIFEFRFKFHWSLFLGFQLTIFQHWFK